MKRRTVLVAGALALSMAGPARAGAVQQLRDFVAGVRGGSADFVQVVTPPEGGTVKTASGRFAFARPDRFRFDYVKPYAQTIVADGTRVWLHDPDLDQVTVRNYDSALGATPAALLAGDSLDRDFTLAELPAHDGLTWVRATPKASDATLRSMDIGFRGHTLERIEIVDRFGQRVALTLQHFDTGVVPPTQRFVFKPPEGADVIVQ